MIFIRIDVHEMYTVCLLCYKMYNLAKQPLWRSQTAMPTKTRACHSNNRVSTRLFVARVGASLQNTQREGKKKPTKRHLSC